MIDLRKLRYFVAVAEELSFSKAAQRLCISQPPLSTQMKELERMLGVTLLQRNSRGVRLTGPGQSFLDKSRLILAQVDAAIHSTQNAARGSVSTIRVGTVGSALYNALPRLVDHVSKRFPSAQVSVCELGTAEQLMALQRDQIDIGLCHTHISTSHVSARRFCEEAYILAVPEDENFEPATEGQLSQFAERPFICFSREISPFLFDNLIVACRRAGFSPNLMHGARHVFTVLHMVRMAFGVALVPASVEQAGLPGIRFVRLRDRIEPVHIGVITRNRPSSIVQEIVDTLPEPSNSEAH